MVRWLKATELRPGLIVDQYPHVLELLQHCAIIERNKVLSVPWIAEAAFNQVPVRAPQGYHICARQAILGGHLPSVVRTFISV